MFPCPSSCMSALNNRHFRTNKLPISPYYQNFHQHHPTLFAGRRLWPPLCLVMALFLGLFLNPRLGPLKSASSVCLSVCGPQVLILPIIGFLDPPYRVAHYVPRKAKYGKSLSSFAQFIPISWQTHTRQYSGQIRPPRGG